MIGCRDFVFDAFANSDRAGHGPQRGGAGAGGQRRLGGRVSARVQQKFCVVCVCVRV